MSDLLMPSNPGGGTNSETRETYRIKFTDTADNFPTDIENLARLALGGFSADFDISLALLVHVLGGGKGQGSSGEESEEGDELGQHFDIGVEVLGMEVIESWVCLSEEEDIVDGLRIVMRDEC